MGYINRIDRAFSTAPVLPVYDYSKFVIMSDCHRGIGNANDNFLKNETLYLSALQTYYHMGYTYIELGDGDELWENRRIGQIQRVHEQVFCILKRYRDSNRLHMIYGNHDMIKSDGLCCQEFNYTQGLVLKDCISNHLIYLTHGHQADLMNSTLWKLSRFLVRYIWRPLELFSIPDPTSASVNHRLRKKTELRLNHWAILQHTPLICGHTHRAVMGSFKYPYFNCGCCISPGSITALELSSRTFSLVKWTLRARPDRTIYVDREPLTEAVHLDELFDNSLE